MSGAGALPPLFVISDDNHGGYVAVALYTLLILMIVTVAARLYTRWYIVRLIRPDDILLMVAVGLGILQAVFVQFAVDHGLGKKREIISENDFATYEKYEYAAQIIIVATIACGKTSLALLVKSLMADGFPLHACRALIGVIALWALSSIIALAFRCSLPHPWEFTGHCINQNALFKSIAALNIVTDAALILLPCTVFYRVHLSSSKRWQIIFLFAARIIVVIATAIQIHYMSILAKSEDKTWANINATIWEQAMLSLSLISTAIPSLGRLIVELQPAVNAFAMTENHGARHSDKYALSSFAGRFPRDYTLEHGLGTHTSVKGERRQSKKSDTESTQSLTRGGRAGSVAESGGIRKEVDFRIA